MNNPSDQDSDDGQDGLFDGPTADAVRSVINDEATGRVRFIMAEYLIEQ